MDIYSKVERITFCIKNSHHVSQRFYKDTEKVKYIIVIIIIINIRKTSRSVTKFGYVMHHMIFTLHNILYVTVK